MTDSSQRGVKIGTRVAQIVTQSIIATHKALIGTKHKLGMALFNAMSDQISDEVHKTVGPYLRQIADHPQSDATMKAYAGFLGTQHGQLTALSGVNIASSSILSSLAQIVNNAAAPVVRDIIAVSPQLALDPSTLANLVAHNILEQQSGQNDTAGQGFNANQFAQLVELARTYPGVADALDMWRRDIIDDNTFNLYLSRNGIPESEWDRIAALLNNPVSPADAALAVLRSDISLADGQAIALKGGINADSFNILMGNTGEPLGLEQLLEAKRRGFIDQARLDRGILQSRVRNEWIDVANQLAFEPMSVADAVNAVVQNQIDFDTASNIAEQNGLESSMFPILVNTAGEPLSRTEMEELYNRGLASEDDVKQAIRESRTKNKYVDLAFQLHAKLPEPRMLADAVEFGSVSNADAIKYAMDAGYSQQIAQLIVGQGTNRKLQTYRDRVMAAVESLYENNVIDAPTASGFVTQLGYSEEDATFILESITFRQQEKIVAAAISAIRSKFIGHHIDQNTAVGFLDSLGVPSGQRDQLITAWSIEEQANVKMLTEAQIVKAAKDSLISSDDATARLVAMGYNATDAALLLAGA